MMIHVGKGGGCAMIRMGGYHEHIKGCSVYQGFPHKINYFSQ